MTAGRISGFFKSFLVFSLVVLQVFIMVVAVHFLRHYFAFIYALLEFACMLVIVMLINENDNQVYKFSWAMIVAILSVSGLLLYFLWGRSSKNRKIRRKIDMIEERSKKFLRRDPQVVDRLGLEEPYLKKLSVYLDAEGFPLYADTDGSFYPVGEQFFDALFCDLEKAEKFIFLEYFIVYRGQIWDRLYEVLKRKAAEGVEIRIMYDDAGSITTNTRSFVSELKTDGIKHIAFNPMYRYVDRLYFNYRNHQKIAVIDGNIAYTGGINIGDEYANLYKKHGHWKDCAVRLEGEGAWGLTRIFLEMWEFSGGVETNDYSIYYPTKKGVGKGFYQPFADGPTNNPRNPAETMYIQMIANAKDFVYITTPYLTPDERLTDTMITAAKSGVDIRIVTPNIFDHWYTRFITRSYYDHLLKNGVKIYEYTPGFMHSKMILSDGKSAIVGSVNLDYRSFYLHYECGVWMCNVPLAEDIKKDFENIFGVSDEISLERWRKRPWTDKAIEMGLRVFAPIM
ncbi:MAG: putative cardiolipin synthase YwiE [Firmicutes bacterium ADurb.Bin193]|nr:MAG: putative cardiolipin synthase YwiE [Firmicutes bacterium ADurb.Bin193]